MDAGSVASSILDFVELPNNTVYVEMKNESNV
jgi:hypothetical protein